MKVVYIYFGDKLKNYMLIENSTIEEDLFIIRETIKYLRNEITNIDAQRSQIIKKLIYYEEKLTKFKDNR